MPTPFFADLVRELAQEGGTGPLTPTGAVPGHRRFAGAVPPGVSFHYAVAGIAHPDQWEVGTGRIDGGGRLLRDVVAASSADGATVDFAAGLKTIALTVGADWFAARDTAAAALAGEVAGLGSELAGLSGALDAKQPLSTTHGSADAADAADMMTVRRGAGWVNVPLSSLAFRGADGRYALDGALGVQRTVDGDMAAIGKEGGQRLHIFASADTIGLFNVADAGTGRDGLRIVDGAVACDIAASEVARLDAGGLKLGAGQLHAPDGSAANPALTFGNDLDTGIYRITGNNLGIAAGGAERFRVNTSGVSVSGNFLAEASANRRIRVVDAAHNTLTNLAAAITFSRGSDIGELAAVMATGNGGIAVAGREGVSLCAGGGSTYSATVEIMRVTGTDMRPAADDTYDLGAASSRFDDVYATNGTIQTSDAREKSWRGAPGEAELRAARRIAGELGFYQWDSAVAAKGADSARLHFGVRAQAVWAIMADEGLIAPLAEGVAPSSRYAFLCFDQWDGAGEGGAAGDRFGIRSDQLALFLIAAQDARLAALEAAA